MSHQTRQTLDEITICGDPHVTLKSLENCARLFGMLEDIGKPVVLLGDQLDTKGIISGPCQNFLYHQVVASKLFWIFLVGNHDLFELGDTSQHSMELFKSLPNVKVIDKVTEIEGLWFVPYIHDQDKLREALSSIPRGAVVFGHFEISGFDFGNGFECKDGLPDHSFRKFKRVISGHFHKHASRGNITYLGTPFSKDFGESNQDKYLGSYKKSSDKLTLLPTDFPRHVTVELNADDPAASQGINANLERDAVRVVLTGSAASIAAWQKVDGIRYDERPNEEAEVLIAESDDHMTQYRTWSEKKQRDPNVIAAGLELLKGAANA